MAQNSDSLNTSDWRKEDDWKTAISSNIFIKPQVTPQSAWIEHIPFAYWLINSATPEILVELGTHYGLSYFCFCEAVKANNLNTKCHAIDNWRGDQHAGYYDDSVFEYVKNVNEQYLEFSELHRLTFQDAVSLFEDNSIDLLHIDGLHTYEAVKHDFNNWLSKISERGIVIFHDTNVKDNDFGVYQLWEELSKQYPFFEFKHGFGLGVLGIGKKMPAKIQELFRLQELPNTASTIRLVYERLGYLTKIEQQYSQTLSESRITEHTGRNYTNPSEKELSITHTQNDSSPLDTNRIISSLGNLEELSIQFYWKKHSNDFNEHDSDTQTIKLKESESLCQFKLEQDFSSIEKLRIDPSKQQGVFYISSITIATSESEIICDWQTIKNTSAFFNLLLFKSTLVENNYVLIATNDDPIIEIDIESIKDLNVTDIQLTLTVSIIDDESLLKEFANITDNQLKKEQHDNSIKIYNALLGNIDIAKKEIAQHVNDNTNAIFGEFQTRFSTAIEKLETEKNILTLEIKDQRESLKKNIFDLNLTLQIKEKLIEELKKEAAVKKEIESDLQKEITQKSFELKLLAQQFEMSQKNFFETHEKANDELNSIKKQTEELRNEFEYEKSLLLQSQQLLSLKDKMIEEMQTKISLYMEKYEKKSILGIIKSRMMK